MKTFAVLIDFTDGSKSALIQAIALAKKINAKVHALHIVSAQEKVKAAEEELIKFVKANNSDGVSVESVVGIGSLTSGTHACLKKIDPDLVIVCTHGIKGMFQQIFGADILKLVQEIAFPCIVIHEHFKTDLSQINSILFPIGPHPDFMVKIKQTAALAKALQASITIYEIDRPGENFEDELAQNKEAAADYFEKHNIAYTKVLEELKFISVGFSRQTLEYAVNNKISILSIMANVSKNDVLFGVGDKENFLVNTQGISVLTCNA